MDSGGQSPRPYRLGVALSGGGARGFAHVGALRAIEEAGLRPDVIAGVSAGAIVAVMYAAGVTLDNIVRVFNDSKFRDFCNWNVGKGALFNMKPLRKLFMKLLGDRVNLEDLNIPVYLGATDFDNGVTVAFHEGCIVDRLIASCSIPIIFPPVKIEGTYYVDGGVLRNHPAWMIREQCETLVGVNCSPLLKGRGTYNSMIDSALRTYNLMVKANQNDDMQMCDISVEIPELAHYKVFNLKEIRSVYLRGYTRMREALRNNADLMPRN